MADRDHLKRSQCVWDRWSDYYGANERDFAPMFEDAVGRLDLDDGETVLDVGCGPGVNLERLRERVGQTGRVVGIDLSPKMVQRARDRVDDHDWANVGVIRGDATRLAVAEETADGVLASLSMSVMPDVEAAVRRVHESLKPDGRFVVFDLRPIPSGVLRIVNPFLTRFYRWFANWNPNEDVLAALRTVFGDVRIERTYAAGAAFTAVATK